MASLIPQDELTTLKSASDVKSVADDAEDIIEQQAAAYAINSAANTGAHSVIWNNPMSPVLKSVLEGQGYTITKRGVNADDRIQFVIGGF